MRITKPILIETIKRINYLLKQNGSNIEYGLNIAYGGYMLIKYEGKGVLNRSHRMTAREMYYALVSIENVLWDMYE